MPQTKPLFGRYNPFVLLFLGFCLTGVVGSWISHKYAQTQSERERVFTERADRARSLLAKREAERAAALEAYHQVSARIDQRLYHSRLVFDACVDGSSLEYTEDRWRGYEECLFRWNENWNRSRASLVVWFGDDVSQQYQDNINWRFVELHRELRNMKLLYGAGRMFDAEGARKHLEGFGEEVFEFNKRLLRLIQSGAVGSFAQECSAPTGRGPTPNTRPSK